MHKYLRGLSKELQFYLVWDSSIGVLYISSEDALFLNKNVSGRVLKGQWGI